MKFKDTTFGLIPENWEVLTIKENTEIVTDYVANGSFASLAENVNYKTEEDVAVLIRLVDYNSSFKGDFVFIDEQAYEFLSKSKLYGKEIIISNVGVNVGTVFRCPKLKYKMSLAPNSIMVKFKGNDDFYFHWLRGHVGQKMLKSIVTGSAQPKFNKTNFRQMLVPVPPITVQSRIAAILNSLDDKIELNNKINENLEQQAQAIFKSWFVDFEPWGGVCPEDWETDKAENFFDITIGKTPPRKEPWWFSENPNDVVWVSISDMGNCGMFISDSSEYLTQESIDKFNVKVVPTNTVLLSFKLTVGRVAICDGEMCTNEAIAHFKSTRTEDVEYLYCYLKAFNYQTMGSTSSIATAVNSKIIKAMPVLMPSIEHLERFHDIVAPIFSEIKENQKQTKNLSLLRDTLLPKLMSGEIDVSEIEI